MKKRVVSMLLIGCLGADFLHWLRNGLILTPTDDLQNILQNLFRMYLLLLLSQQMH